MFVAIPQINPIFVSNRILLPEKMEAPPFQMQASQTSSFEGLGDCIVLPGNSAPEHPLTLENVDAFIAKEMTRLSIAQREQIYYDVHGIAAETAATPAVICESLERLEIEILLVEEKTAYDMAMSMDEKYAMDRSLRIRFLRADCFDAKKAALRLARHFQAKLDLFGPERLVKDIVQDDLDEQTIEAIYSGTMCKKLPSRDRAGRVTVAVSFMNKIRPDTDPLTKVSYGTKCKDIQYPHMNPPH